MMIAKIWTEPTKMLNFNGYMLELGRGIRGMTQVQLSEKSGVSQAAISRYENGEEIPYSDVVEQLAIALCFPFIFFTREGKPHPKQMYELYCNHRGK
jgi:transcriptional regulator with XRE-family HTH domain